MNPWNFKNINICDYKLEQSLDFSYKIIILMWRLKGDIMEVKGTELGMCMEH